MSLIPETDAHHLHQAAIHLYYAAISEQDRAWLAEQPSYMLRPKLSRDGDKWCALYGDNLQDGVAGFGDSPKLAYAAFDKAWVTPLPQMEQRGMRCVTCDMNKHVNDFATTDTCTQCFDSGLGDGQNCWHQPKKT